MQSLVQEVSCPARIKSVMRRVLSPNVLALGFFALLVCILTYPLVFHLTDYATGTGDELVIAWIQNWVIHSLLTNPLQLFHANIFYPYPNTLAYSDLFLTSSIIALIPLLIFHQPILVNNLTLVYSLILLGFSLYLLSFELTKDRFASILSGVLILCSPTLWDRIMHLQIICIFFVPIAILLFIKFLKSQKFILYIFSLVCFVLQTWNSFLPGYFILFFYTSSLIVFFFTNRKTFFSLFAGKYILPFFIAIGLIIPFIVPYESVAREFNYSRDIRDAIHFAIQPEDLYYPNNFTRLSPYLMLLHQHEQTIYGEVKSGYLGGEFSILGIAALLFSIKLLRKKREFIHLSILVTCLLSFVLSFGPALHWGRRLVHWPFLIPLPYALFYYVLPGFNGFRNSARFEMLFILMLAVLCAVFLHNLLCKFSLLWQKIIYLLLIFAVVCEFGLPIHFVKIPQIKQFPPEYSYLKTLPYPTPLVELPIFDWGSPSGSQIEIWREYYSTLDWHSMVNGYSGFFPTPWLTMQSDLTTYFPSISTIQLLQRIHVKLIVIHTDEYTSLSKEAPRQFSSGEIILTKLKKFPQLTRIKHFGHVYIYKLR